MTEVASNGSELDRMLKIPRANWIVTSDKVRHLWKDIEQDGQALNEIFPDLLKNIDYDRAICLTVIAFNTHPPFSLYDPRNFPDEYYLLWGAFAEILKILEGYHANNYFTGSSGGVAVPVHERFQALQPIRSRIEGELVERRTRLKRRQHIREAFGSTDHYTVWRLSSSRY